MDSMLNCIIHSLKEVHKSRSIALKITESLKRNKALPEENLTTPFEYARKHAGNNPDRSAFITLRGQKKRMLLCKEIYGQYPLHEINE